MMKNLKLMMKQMAMIWRNKSYFAKENMALSYIAGLTAPKGRVMGHYFGVLEEYIGQKYGGYLLSEAKNIKISCKKIFEKGYFSKKDSCFSNPERH